MKFEDTVRRAFATFVAGATAAPITAVVVDISFFKAASIAGLIAVWNWAGRLAQMWLTEAP